MKNFSNFHNCPKSFPKVRKRVLNKCWVKFFEQFFCPVFHGGSSIRNVFKKSKIFQNSIIAQNRSQKCANVFWTCFGVIFSKIFFAQCSMEGRVCEMFLKNQKTFKIPKKPKIVPKSAQTRFEHVLRYFFRNFFLPSVPWRVEYSKCFQKIENISKFHNCPKSFPKVRKRVLNMFWGNFFENFFCPVFHGGRVFEMFLKKFKKFKIPKTPKIVPKLSKSVLNMFWGNFFEKFILPSVPWRVEYSKCFQKIENISKFHNCPKSFPKVRKRVLNMFWGNFFEIFFCPVFHGGSSLRNVFKKSKNFHNSKKAQNRSQKCANAFWTCFEVIFSKIFFAECSMEGRVFEMFSKNRKYFKIP